MKTSCNKIEEVFIEYFKCQKCSEILGEYNTTKGFRYGYNYVCKHCGLENNYEEIYPIMILKKENKEDFLDMKITENENTKRIKIKEIKIEYLLCEKCNKQLSYSDKCDMSEYPFKYTHICECGHKNISTKVYPKIVWIDENDKVLRSRMF